MKILNLFAAYHLVATALPRGCFGHLRYILWEGIYVTMLICLLLFLSIVTLTTAPDIILIQYILMS